MTMVIRAVLFFWLAFLAGCTQSEVKQVLTDISKDCERHYAGNLGGVTGLGANVTFQIDCKASGTTTTTTTTFVPANPASGAGQ
jgi:hypothetical protein